MNAKKQASLQAARATGGRKRKYAKERNEILCNNLSLPKRRRDDKSFDDDFRRIVDFHLLIRKLKNSCHYCWQRPLLLSNGILQDQRSQIPDKFKSCAGAVRGCHMFLLTIPLKLTRSSSWLAYIQAQVIPTSTPA